VRSTAALRECTNEFTGLLGLFIGDESQQIADWRSKLCSTGVRLALAGLPPLQLV
jgi:hypothetical protein